MRKWYEKPDQGKFWVVYWIKDGQPGSMATLDYDKADKKIRTMFERGAIVYVHEHTF